MFFIIIVLNKIKKLAEFFFVIATWKGTKKIFKILLWNKKEFFFFFFLPQWWGEKKTSLIFLFCCCNAWKSERSCLIEFFCFVGMMCERRKENLAIFLFCCCDAWKNKEKPSFFFVVWMGKGMKEKLHYYFLLRCMKQWKKALFLFCCCNKCTFITMMHKRTPLPCFSLCKLGKLVHCQALRRNYKNKCR